MRRAVAHGRKVAEQSVKEGSISSEGSKRSAAGCEPPGKCHTARLLCLLCCWANLHAINAVNNITRISSCLTTRTIRNDPSPLHGRAAFAVTLVTTIHFNDFQEMTDVMIFEAVYVHLQHCWTWERSLLPMTPLG